MRKATIINLIRCHAEGNDVGFFNEAVTIAQEFEKAGDSELAQYVMSLISHTGTLSPQVSEVKEEFLDSEYFEKVATHALSSLPLPQAVSQDILGLINAVHKNLGIHKFLFYGKPGTGKTESVKQISRILGRDLYSVNFSSLIDSKLGQSQKNLHELFSEMNQLVHPDKLVILFDEIDALVLDRTNEHDVREMGRLTSSFLKELDRLNQNLLLIATTNLYAHLDSALLRRFDFSINFDRYSQQDLLEVAEAIFSDLTRRTKTVAKNSRLFKKILLSAPSLPNPGDMKNIIRSAVAFSDPSNPNDYFKRLYSSLNPNDAEPTINTLKEKGFTLREIEILSGVSKSEVSRLLNSQK